MDQTAASQRWDVLTRRGWLADATPEFAKALIESGRLRTFSRGEVMHREGDAPGGIYGLVGGGIGIITTRADGEPILGHILRPGSWSGEAPLMGSGRRTLTYRATEASQVLCVPLVALERLAQADPQARRNYGNLTERVVNTAVGIINDLLIPNAERRIAATLLRVTGVDGDSAPDPADSFIMSQTDIGEMANASRNHVNRTLLRFRAADWVSVRYNRVAILDAPALRAFVIAGQGGSGA